jgi:phosphate uptake regulator
MADDSLEAIEKNDKAWLEAIALHDKDVNKIADFCRRVLNTAGAEGYKRIAPVYFIVEQLEKIGDMYRDICQHHLKRPVKISPELKKVYKETNLFFRGFYDLCFDFDLAALNDFARKRYSLREIFEACFSSLPQKEMRTLYFLNSIVESTFDMNGPLMAAKL